MSRNTGDFDAVLGSLKFSLSAENDIGGLDEALQKFAEEKARASMRRRGPVEGIPDDDSIPVQFEIAKDVVACSEHFIFDEDLNEFPDSVLNSNAAESNNSGDSGRDLIDFDTPIEEEEHCQLQTEGHNTDQSPSGVPQRRNRRRQCRRRTVSLGCADQVGPNSNTDDTARRPSRLSVYLAPADILNYIQKPFLRRPPPSPPNLPPPGGLDEVEGEMDPSEKSGMTTSVSLPDMRVENGSLQFKCWAPVNLVSSKSLTGYDCERIRQALESNPHYLPIDKKRDSTSPASILPPIATTTNPSPDPGPPGGKPVRRRKPAPQVPPLQMPPTPPPRPDNEDEEASTTEKPSAAAAEPPASVTRRRPPPIIEGAVVPTSMTPKPSVASDTKPLAKFFLSEEPGVAAAAAAASTASASEGPPKAMAPLVPAKPSRRSRKTRKVLSMFRLYAFLSALVALLLACWLFTVSPFLWGTVVGGVCTYLGLRLYYAVVTYLYYPSSSSSSGGGGVVAASSSTLSLLRDFQSPPVPHLVDEDLKTGPSSGPLGESLGYKLDQANRPIYKAWMNEIVSYSPETYHINSTHSVYVTLEGTQLRIQRPRRNVPRRAMFNMPLPSAGSVTFVHQRILDLTRVQVGLLPQGLVAKRLWSKKYPICLTILPPTPDNKATDGGTEKSRKLKHSGSVSTINSAGSLEDGEITISGKPSKTFDDISSSAYSVSTSRYLRVATNEKETLTTFTEVPANQDQAAVEDFMLVRPADLEEKIYLFARTCREKEAWFRRLKAASLGKPLMTTAQQAFKQLLTPQAVKTALSSPHMRQCLSTSDFNAAFPTSVSSQEGAPSPVDDPHASTGRQASVSSSSAKTDSDAELQMAYLRHMAKFMPASWLLRASQALQLNLNYVACDSQVPWLNALMGRLLWDFLRHEYWQKKVQDKIQSKLKKLHLPYFVNELIVTHVDMGNELPVIRNAGKPFLDNQGLWIELEIVYAGGFTVSLETNINLLKLRDKNFRVSGGSNSKPYQGTEAGSSNFVHLSSSTGGAANNSGGGLAGGSETASEQSAATGRSIAAYLSDEEDSADSSTDSDERETALSSAFASIITSASNGHTAPTPDPATAAASNTTSADPAQAGQTTEGSLVQPRYALPVDSSTDSSKPRRRLYRIMDRITRSTYFQRAVDSKFVQRGMEYVSNKAINLQLEMSMLHGTLVLNVPPPPSDRVWYGFRGNPNLRFKLKPKFGETLVTIPRVIEILEKKIILEFQRVFVLPNMDDVVMPLLIPEPFLRPTREPERSNSTAEALQPSNKASTPPPQSRFSVGGSRPQSPMQKERRDSQKSEPLSTISEPRSGTVG